MSVASAVIACDRRSDNAILFNAIILFGIIAVFNLVCQKYQVEFGHKLVVCKPTSTRLVELGQKAEMVNSAKSGC